jgi:hypothetical protein
MRLLNETEAHSFFLGAFADDNFLSEDLKQAREMPCSCDYRTTGKSAFCYHLASLRKCPLFSISTFFSAHVDTFQVVVVFLQSSPSFSLGNWLFPPRTSICFFDEFLCLPRGLSEYASTVLYHASTVYARVLRAEDDIALPHPNTRTRCDAKTS